MRPHTPVSPGLIIKEEMRELGLSDTDLAKILEMPLIDIKQLLNSHLMIDTTIANKLSELFGCSSEFYLNLEREYRCDLFC